MSILTTESAFRPDFGECPIDVYKIPGGGWDEFVKFFDGTHERQLSMQACNLGHSLLLYAFDVGNVKKIEIPLNAEDIAEENQAEVNAAIIDFQDNHMDNLNRIIKQYTVEDPTALFRYDKSQTKENYVEISVKNGNTYTYHTQQVHYPMELHFGMCNFHWPEHNNDDEYYIGVYPRTTEDGQTTLNGTIGAFAANHAKDATLLNVSPGVAQLVYPGQYLVFESSDIQYEDNAAYGGFFKNGYETNLCEVMSVDPDNNQITICGGLKEDKTAGQKIDLKAAFVIRRNFIGGMPNYVGHHIPRTPALLTHYNIEVWIKHKVAQTNDYDFKFYLAINSGKK